MQSYQRIHDQTIAAASSADLVSYLQQPIIYLVDVFDVLCAWQLQDRLGILQKRAKAEDEIEAARLNFIEKKIKEIELARAKMIRGESSEAKQRVMQESGKQQKNHAYSTLEESEESEQQSFVPIFFDLPRKISDLWMRFGIFNQAAEEENSDKQESFELTSIKSSSHASRKPEYGSINR